MSYYLSDDIECILSMNMKPGTFGIVKTLSSINVCMSAQSDSGENNLLVFRQNDIPIFNRRNDLDVFSLKNTKIRVENEAFSKFNNNMNIALGSDPSGLFLITHVLSDGPFPIECRINLNTGKIEPADFSKTLFYFPKWELGTICQFSDPPSFQTLARCDGTGIDVTGIRIE